MPRRHATLFPMCERGFRRGRRQCFLERWSLRPPALARARQWIVAAAFHGFDSVVAHDVAAASENLPVDVTSPLPAKSVT